MAKPKWHGEKLAGRHTTVIDAAKPVLKKADALPRVKKISLGFIKMTPGSSGERRLKFKDMQGGLQVTVRGNSSVQDIWIYTDSPVEVQQQLELIRL